MNSPKKRLIPLTILYLALPNVLFIAFWLRPWLSACFGLLLVFCLWQSKYHLKLLPEVSKAGSRTLWILGAALILTYLVGIGEFTPQKSDYEKHNLIFHDLIHYSFPVSYVSEVYQQPYLCYYVAYYLPTACLTKLTGIAWANEISFLWGALGIGLTLAWLWRLVGSAFGLVFFLIGGLDYLVSRLQLLFTMQQLPHWYSILLPSLSMTTHGKPQYGLVFSNGLVENRLEFPAPFVQLNWAPQHALGAWLATALIWYFVQQKKYRLIGLIWALTLLWSPLVSLGLLPLLFFCLLSKERKSLFSITTIGLGGGICLLMGAYFLGHFPQDCKGVLLDALTTSQDIILYIAFIVAQFGLYFFLIKRLNTSQEDQQFALLASLGMFFCTFFYLGKFNDFGMRAVLPSQFMLLVVWLKTLRVLWLDVSKPIRFLKPYRFTSITLFLCIVLSTYKPLGSLMNISKQILKNTPSKYPTIEALATQKIDITRMKTDPDFPETDFNRQYLGSNDSFFRKYLAKE